MAEVLTDLERRVLDYLVEYLRTNTYQPSIREIGRTFGIKSTKTVSELLQSLADKGWIERDPSRSRGVKLLGVEIHTHSISVPMQHSMRTDATHDLDTLELDRRIASRGTFLIIMPDDGLSSSGIQRGDMLLVEPVTNDQLESGDIVLASTADAQYVRRYAAQPNMHLESDDARAAPVALGPSGPKVDGRVISVVRRLRAPATVAAAITT
jgi:repressor LexA